MQILKCRPSYEKDRQCTHNVTMRHVHVTIVAVKNKLLSNILRVSLYSCRTYPSGKSHLLYTVLYSHL